MAAVSGGVHRNQLEGDSLLLDELGLGVDP